MRGYRVVLAWLVIATSGWSARAGGPAVARPGTPSPDVVPLEQLPPGVREEIRQVLARPTLAAQGPAETFACRPEQYEWLLDHPDRAVTAWRRLGAKCVAIVDQGNGFFGWTDDTGSSVTWQTVYRDAEKRIWYAWGKVRPAALLPLVPVRVVLVLHHQRRADDGRVKDGAKDGATIIHHRADLFMHTDSKTAGLVARMLGASAPRLAEQGLSQLQMFFSALSAYLERHPQDAEALLKAE